MHAQRCDTNATLSCPCMPRCFLALERNSDHPTPHVCQRIPPGTKPIPYINNLPGFFCCIRAGANTGVTCIRAEMNSLKNLANMRKMIPQKNLPVFARVGIQAPHVIAQTSIPQEFFLHVLVLCRGACPQICHTTGVRMA